MNLELAQATIPFKPDQAPLELFAESESSASVEKVVKSKESNPFVLFIAGCVMVPFALVLLWKNEKKLVTYAKCIGQAEKAFKRIDLEHPFDENELVLVAGTGLSCNKQDICDQEFGATVQDSYRLVRTVEMLQWVETEHTEHHDGHKKTTYEYSKQWRDSRVKSENFHNSGDHMNPDHWPFQTSTFEAQNVNLGGFRLPSLQCRRLGTQNVEVNWTDLG